MPVQNTNIGWTDYSGNGWAGCVKTSEGCMNCWAEDMGLRFDRTPLPWTIQNVDANLTVYDDDMADLLDRKQPGWCFYPSASDPFLPWLPDDAKRDYWHSIEVNEHICFQVLTKWGPEYQRSVQGAKPHEYAPERSISALPDHVMLGVTVESELREYRLDWLREQDAGMKFVSFEPLLEPITSPNLEGIDWAIIGGESGHDRREWNPEWASSLIVECSRQDVAPYFKQHGDLHAEQRTEIEMGDWKGEIHHFPETPSGLPDAPREYLEAEK